MRRILFVVTSIFLMIGVIFYFGIKVNDSKYHEFVNDGYVIGRTNLQSGNVQSTKHYFSSGTKYKKNYEEKYVFKNTDSEEITVNSNTFVHYLDGSISTLDKTVILDLDKLDTDIIKYYNFYVGSRLKKEGSYYIAQNLNNQLKFSSFLMKIDEFKYLLVAPKINLYVGDSKKEINNDYLEIQFFDGNIIRLENQEVQMQNISSNFYIELENNIKINLADKNILLNDVRVLNMTQMTVDRDDNIEIPPEDEEENNGNNSGNNGNNGNGGNGDNNGGNSNKPIIDDNPLDGLLPGTIPGENDDPNEKEELDENDRLKEPTFSVTNMDVTSNKFAARVEYQDSEGLLTGDITLKIVETGTNKIVYQSRENTGLNNFEIQVENLNQNTNYVFVVNSDYRHENQIYNRDFLQKTFITESVGVSLEKNYFAKDSLSFNIRAEDYSRVEKVEISLTDSYGQIVSTQEVNLKNLVNNKAEVVFGNLKPNADYQVKIYNFLYDNSIIADKFTIEENFKTLKQKPTFGNPTFTIDKRNSQFSLKVNNITDIDNGIISYRYEIYDARSLTDNLNDIPVPVQIVEKSGKGGAEVAVDDTVLQRGIPYKYKMVVVFEDNEKQYEYETSFSDAMQMDGVEFPTIRMEFENEEKDVTFERIKGNIVINDPNGTIFSETLTVVYSNSIGNAITFTSSKNDVIPFDKNDLRANETYTISVYGSVDLQDGNDPIDNCLIGSTIVKTKETKPILLDWNLESGDTSSAFKIRAQFTAESNIDNTLEAKTLSSLVFNIYSGRTTSGTLVKSIKKVDRNLAPYESDLKEHYYDEEFIIDPSFFDIRNQDLQSEYYTIEVVNAQDYTTYRNPIEIKNNIIQVQTNASLPDIPTNTDDAIEVVPIRNQYAGDKYRPELEPDTIVGYQIRAKMDNAKNIIKNIKYKIINAETGEQVGETIESPVNNDGTIPRIPIYFDGDGTPKEITDTDFRRGNKYYFTFIAECDTSNDGAIDSIYPPEDSGITLKSKTQSPEKQGAIFKTYPSTYRGNKGIWAYNYTDIDSTLETNVIYYRVGSQERGTILINSSSDETFHEIELDVPISSDLTFYVKQSLIKSDEITDRNIVFQYYEVPYNIEAPLYHLEQNTNSIVIKFMNYSDPFYKRVAGAKLVFKAAGQNDLVKDNLLMENDGTITVDLAELEQFLGIETHVDVSLYYDTGITGFDKINEVSEGANRFALQKIKNLVYNGEYYRLNDRLNLTDSPEAFSSMFKMSLIKENNKTTLNLKDLIKNQSINLALELDELGYSYNNEHLFPKYLDELILSSDDGRDSINFNTIIPGISLRDQNGKSTIIPTLVNATVGMTLRGNSQGRIKDNKIYLEIFEVNESGGAALIQTITKTTDELDNIFIDKLKPKTDYILKVYAEIKQGSSFVKTQLYDVDYREQHDYNFSTSQGVGISNIKINYSANSYKDKKLVVTYDLKEILGYDYISYTLYKVDETKDGNIETHIVPIEIKKDNVFDYEMRKEINIPPESGVKAGEKYIFEISAGIEYNGEKIVLESTRDATYNFSRLSQPYIGVSANRSSSGETINFQVNIYDLHKVIVDDTYQVRFYDEENNDITPSTYLDENYSTNDYTQQFDLGNLSSNKKYHIKVLYKTNVLNDPATIEEKEKIYTAVALNEDGVSIGDLYAGTNVDNPSNINLIFYGSSKLDTINGIRYSIYSSNGYAIDKETTFSPVLHTDMASYYYTFTLTAGIRSKGVYIIQVQFLKDGQVIAEEAIQYNYL